MPQHLQYLHGVYRSIVMNMTDTSLTMPIVMQHVFLQQHYMYAPIPHGYSEI